MWQLYCYGICENIYQSGVQVSWYKVLCVNFSVWNIYDFATISLRPLESYSYLTDVNAAKLWWHVVNMNMTSDRYSTRICKSIDLIPALHQSDCRIPNRMAWQWAETLVGIGGTLADIRGTTKWGIRYNFPKHEFNRFVCLEARHYLLAHLS